jgi:[DsrC]-trisulfide reductase subunit O
MKITRKDFLRLTGLSLLAAGVMRAMHKVEIAAQTNTAAPFAGAPRKQLAMAIDLRKCRRRPGCDSCIRACNSAHNIPSLPDDRHAVKWIWGEPFASVFPADQTEYTLRSYSASPVPVLCNHCEHPPCVEVCPTGATWKRAEDGIVMMDWHRCIGCKYCMVACPYGARSFNFIDPRPYIARINPDFPTRALGVVEKCNFCEERLAEGRLPACVEACPEKAMAFGDVFDPSSAVSLALAANYGIRRKPQLGTQPNVFYIV